MDSDKSSNLLSSTSNGFSFSAFAIWNARNKTRSEQETHRSHVWCVLLKHDCANSNKKLPKTTFCKCHILQQEWKSGKLCPQTATCLLVAHFDVNCVITHTVEGHPITKAKPVMSSVCEYMHDMFQSTFHTANLWLLSGKHELNAISNREQVDCRSCFVCRGK